MTKQEVHGLFLKSIETLISEAKNDVSKANILESASDQLGRINNSIFVDIPNEERLQMYTSFSGFFSKEFSVECPKLSSVVSEPVFEYAKLFNLIDKEILKLMSE